MTKKPEEALTLNEIRALRVTAIEKCCGETTHYLVRSVMPVLLDRLEQADNENSKWRSRMVNILDEVEALDETIEGYLNDD